MADVTWRQLVEEAMQKNGEAWADVESITLYGEAWDDVEIIAPSNAGLDVAFRDGFGPDDLLFTVWTQNCVYIDGCRDDGVKRVEILYRYPDEKPTAN